MKKLFILILFTNFAVFSQNETLEGYIRIGLSNNLELKQKNFDLKKSEKALNEAVGMFMPSIGINARYTRSGGGREITFPLGDIVNPIYGTLNYLLQQNTFPTNIGNEVIPFLREKEHETKIGLVQPIFQPAIYYNYKIQNKMLEMSKMEKDIYKRNLISEIKKAYLNFLKTKSVEKIYSSTLNLLKENLRVSQSLFKNNKVTIDVVYRAKAEIAGIEQKILEANKNNELAISYLNFLLNRPLQSEVVFDTTGLSQNYNYNFDDSYSNAIQEREELKELHLASEIYSDKASISFSKFLPGISLAADYGYQGEKYQFDKNHDFWTASVVMQWNLFNGFKDISQKEQAEIEVDKIKSKIEETKKQIALQVMSAIKEYDLALSSIKSAGELLKSIQASFRIVNKKFDEGITSYIEFLDSRNKLTQSQIQEVVATYDYQQKVADLEKAAALVNLAKYHNNENK